MVDGWVVAMIVHCVWRKNVLHSSPVQSRSVRVNLIVCTWNWYRGRKICNNLQSSIHKQVAEWKTTSWTLTRQASKRRSAARYAPGRTPWGDRLIGRAGIKRDTELWNYIILLQSELNGWLCTLGSSLDRESRVSARSSLLNLNQLRTRPSQQRPCRI